jgi:hypothetical protein
LWPLDISYINLRFYIIGRYFLVLEDVGIGWHECLMQDRYTRCNVMVKEGMDAPTPCPPPLGAVLLPRRRSLRARRPPPLLSTRRCTPLRCPLMPAPFCRRGGPSPSARWIPPPGSRVMRSRHRREPPFTTSCCLVLLLPSRPLILFLR